MLAYFSDKNVLFSISNYFETNSMAINLAKQTLFNTFAGQMILLTVNMRCQLQKVCATWLLPC